MALAVPDFVVKESHAIFEEPWQFHGPDYDPIHGGHLAGKEKEREVGQAREREVDY